MPVPATALDAARRPFTVAKIGAVFQRLTDLIGPHGAPQAANDKPRSVADLLEFGYCVSSADRRYPHMPS